MTRGAELAARGLSVGYRRHDELKQVLADVSLTLRPGVIVGLAGESGCGKSTLGLALTGYRPPGVVVLDGDVGLAGESLLDMPERRLSRLWGRRIAFVPQNAATALDPALTVGRQLREPLRQHLGLKGRDAESRAKELLERVDLEQPAAALGRYPHQFSGGQQQRIALSMALACQPDVIVLDEPTTGLDVTTQARVNELVVRLVREDGMAVLYVSHDLALLATLCDRLVVMYAGEIVEEGPAIELFARPRHPYTAALLRALPSARHGRRPKGLAGIPPAHTVTERCAFVDRCEFSSDACLKPVPLRQLNGRDVRCVRAEELTLKRDAVGTVATESRGMGAAVLEIENLRCVYPRERVVAVSGLSLALARGQVIGIAGESGSGKSTLLRCLAGLVGPDAGSVRLAGEPLAPLVGRRTAEQRRLLQLVFQNPDASLNPRHTVHALLERPLRVFRHELDAAADGTRLPASSTICASPIACSTACRWS